jgi:hypothetical protein
MVGSVSCTSGNGLSEAPLGSPDLHIAAVAPSPDAAQPESTGPGLVVGMAGDRPVSAAIDGLMRLTELMGQDVSTAAPELFRPAAEGDGCA